MQSPYDVQIMYRCLRDHVEVCSLVAYFDLATDTAQPNTPSYTMAAQYSNMNIAKTLILEYLGSTDSDARVQSDARYAAYTTACDVMCREYADKSTHPESVPLFLLCSFFESVREYVVAAWHRRLQQFAVLHAFKLERIYMRAADCILQLEHRADYGSVLQDRDWCEQVVRDFDAAARFHFCASVVLSAVRTKPFQDFSTKWFATVHGPVGNAVDTVLGKTRDEMARFVRCWYEGILETEAESTHTPRVYQNIAQQLESCTSIWVSIKIISVVAQHSPEDERLGVRRLVEDAGTEKCCPCTMSEVQRVASVYLREMEYRANSMPLHTRVWFGCSLLQYTQFCAQELLSEAHESAIREVHSMLTCMEAEMKIFLCNLCRHSTSNTHKLMDCIRAHYVNTAFPYDRLHKWLRSSHLESTHAGMSVLLVRIAGPEFFDMIMRCSMFFQTRVFRYCPLEMRRCVGDTLNKSATFEQLRTALYTVAPNHWNPMYTGPAAEPSVHWTAVGTL